MASEEDILISYAHLGNQALVAGEDGWVSRLHRLLEIRVGQLLGEKPRIWRDPKLQGNDFFAVYEPSEKLTAVGSFEARLGSLKAQPDVFSYDLDAPSNPDRQTLGPLHPKQIQHTDLGVYAQASYRLKKNLKVIVGGRLDYNEITNRREPGYGFGTLFTSRLAAVYTLGRAVLKAIYSEAFKDPTDFEKLGTMRSPGGRAPGSD